MDLVQYSCWVSGAHVEYCGMSVVVDEPYGQRGLRFDDEDDRWMDGWMDGGQQSRDDMSRWMWD